MLHEGGGGQVTSHVAVPSALQKQPYWVVPSGQARAAAEQLAAELAAFPASGLRGDRLSAYEQQDLDLEAALANELQHGSRALTDGVQGARRFTSDG